MLEVRTPKNYGKGFIMAEKNLPEADHVFGTKQEANFDNAEDTVKSYTERLGAIAHMRQVHGDRIAYSHGPGLYEEADAIYTDHRDLWLAVKTADCVPVLVSTPLAVGAAHCGWRGLKNGLLPKLLDTMMDEFAMSPLDVFVHVGPHISQQNYEVEQSFTQDFDEKFFRESDKKGHVLMDMAGIVKAQAVEAGVPDINIHNADLCTFEKDKLFHSYRRAKKEKQPNHRVQLSLVRREKNAL